MGYGIKVTGGKYHKQKKKKHYEKRGQQRTVFLGETSRKTQRIRGGSQKSILLKSNIANVLISPGKTKKSEIKNVLETPQNKFLARQNILAKGAIIETSLGKARITNRPTQEGHINAILIQ